MTQLGLLVTDASPLITLAAADALDCLTMPGLRVLIPDMVYFEVMQDLARTGAAGVVEWARRHPGQVEIVPTTSFAEFQTLRAADPATRSRGRGELAALEVLHTEIDRTPDLAAVLLFEDNDVRTRRFVRALPERVAAVSTGDLLHELGAAGRTQSSDHTAVRLKMEQFQLFVGLGIRRRVGLQGKSRQERQFFEYCDRNDLEQCVQPPSLSRFRMMATRTYMETAIQICVFTAFSEVPQNRLICRCCLIHDLEGHSWSVEEFCRVVAPSA